MASRRKSTDMIKRRSQTQVDELEEKALTPQEQRRQFLLNLGVWFLVLAFCMTSGIMCFSIGGQEKQMAQQAAAQEANSTKYEIERWEHEVSANPNDAMALANLGFYWGKMAEELDQPKDASKDKKDEAEAKSEEPKVTKAEAVGHAKEYFERALQVDPTYIVALKNYAEFATKQKDNVKARELYEKIVTVCDAPVSESDEDAEAAKINAMNNKSQAVLSLVRLEIADKNYDSASKRLEALLKEQPHNLDAVILKGGILADKEGGDKEEALKCYATALNMAKQMGGDYAQVILSCYMARITLLKDLGRSAEVTKEAEECKSFFKQAGVDDSAITGIINSMAGIKTEEKKGDKAVKSDVSAAKDGAVAADSATATAEAASPTTTKVASSSETPVEATGGSDSAESASAEPVATPGEAAPVE